MSVRCRRRESRTPREREAEAALAQFERETAARRTALESELATARAEAEAVRYGLLYATGRDLVKVVGAVLRSAGFDVEDLDATFGGEGRSADLLATIQGKHWLVEVRSCGGSAAEAYIDDAMRHVRTWQALGRKEPLEGAVLVLNHDHKQEAPDRPPAYRRRDFVASLPCPIVGTPALFTWVQADERESIVTAVTGPPLVY